jgi:hypothetical protein
MQRLLDGLVLIGLVCGVYYVISPAFRMWVHTKPRVRFEDLPKLFDDERRPVMMPIFEGTTRVGVRASTKYLDIKHRVYPYKRCTVEIIDVSAKYMQGADIRIENGVVTQVRYVGIHGTPKEEVLTQSQMDSILTLRHCLRLHRMCDDTLSAAQLASVMK